MGPVSTTTTIDVPRERVFELLSDLSVRPTFCDHFIDGFHLERIDPVGVGASARFRLRASGEWMGIKIDEVSRPHLVRERGRGGRFNRVPVYTVWELAPGPSAGSCEVAVTFWTEPDNPLDRVREMLGAAWWFRRSWGRALARLKALAESGRAPERVVVAGLERLGA